MSQLFWDLDTLRGFMLGKINQLSRCKKRGWGYVTGKERGTCRKYMPKEPKNLSHPWTWTDASSFDQSIMLSTVWPWQKPYSESHWGCNEDRVYASSDCSLFSMHLRSKWSCASNSYSSLPSSQKRDLVHLVPQPSNCDIECEDLLCFMEPVDPCYKALQQNMKSLWNEALWILMLDNFTT